MIQNIGPFETSIKVSNMANGDYLYDVADDDYFYPNTIERFQKALLRDGQVPSCSLDKLVVDKNGYTLSKRSKNWTSMGFHAPNDCLTNYLLIEPAHHSLSAASLVNTKVHSTPSGFTAMN